MIIRMKKSDYDAVVQYCLSGLPNESCGLIAGFVDGDVKSIFLLILTIIMYILLWILKNSSQQSRMQEVLV